MERVPNFDNFSSAVFSGEIHLKQIKEQKRLSKSEGILKKIFLNLFTVMAIFVLSEPFSGKFCLKCLLYFCVLRQILCILTLFAHFRLCVLKA